MKFQLVILAVLGLVAALAASVLVGTMKADGSRKSDEVQVVVAARALSATTPVDADDVTVKTITRSQAPVDCVSDPVQIIGQVLTVSVLEGQALTKNCFAPEGSGYHIASTLPLGMRAMSVSLADYSRLHGLLYPGSVVDVLASFKVPSTDRKGTDVVSVTLLRSVEVLAVEDRTVTKSEEKPEKAPTGLYDRRKRVTLMVNSKQAEALQVAMENGEISLTLRNPRDTSPVDERVTRLSDLSRELKRLLDDAPATAPNAPASPGGLLGAIASGLASLAKAAPAPTTAAAAPASPVPPAPAEVKAQPTPAHSAWTTRVLKGGKESERQFEVETVDPLGATPVSQKQ